jgi:hypothetical protein
LAQDALGHGLHLGSGAGCHAHLCPRLGQGLRTGRADAPPRTGNQRSLAVQPKAGQARGGLGTLGTLGALVTVSLGL